MAGLVLLIQFTLDITQETRPIASGGLVFPVRASGKNKEAVSKVPEAASLFLLVVMHTSAQKGVKEQVV